MSNIPPPTAKGLGPILGPLNGSIVGAIEANGSANPNVSIAGPGIGAVIGAVIGAIIPGAPIGPVPVGPVPAIGPIIPGPAIGGATKISLSIPRASLYAPCTSKDLLANAVASFIALASSKAFKSSKKSPPISSAASSVAYTSFALPNE